jgi:hypothetical protein
MDHFTSLRADPAHEAGHSLADLIWAILLKEMASFHCHFGLVRPGAAEFALPPHQNGTRIGVEEELWDIGLRKPGRAPEVRRCELPC